MFEEKDYFHPLFHPSPNSIITACYVDDAPLIYCGRGYGEERGSGGEDFVPDELIVTPQWKKIILRNRLKFIAPSDRPYQTLISTFDCDRELNTNYSWEELISL